MTRVAILGSTGSIGTQTLDVIRTHPTRFQVVGLAAHSNAEALANQCREFNPKYRALFADTPTVDPLLRGMPGLLELASASDVDLVVVSVAGMIGLEPTIAAIKSGKRIALASKEVLVAGGEVVMPLVRQHGTTLLPIDSEHSAILQCIFGVPPCADVSHWNQGVSELILTASGGPFRGRSIESLKQVTVEDALNHPTWRMGGKITIDSATLMNKGLEIIEACWLYDLPPSKVSVVVHPQSVIHSMVRFEDGSVLSQMGHPDMKLPIQFALLGPERQPSPAKHWDPMHTPNLTFEPLDETVFTCPGIAKAAFAEGGVLPAFMNAVNEEAANAFLRNEIRFLDIPKLNEESLKASPKMDATLENILAADSNAREWSRSRMRELRRD